jgi:hypothetical protein
LADIKASYRCQNVVPIFWNKNIDYDQAAARAGELWTILARTIINNPLPFLKHQACVTSMLWHITQPRDEAMSVVTLGITEIPAAAEMGLYADPVIHTLKTILSRYAEETIDHTLLWRPGLYLFLMLVLLGVMCLRQAAWWPLLIGLPVIGNTLSLVPIIAAPDFRYQYGVVLVTAMLLPLLWRRGRSV